MNTLYPLKTLSQLRPFLVGFRKEKGLTQKDVAARLGVTQQTYARLEANPASASMERLFRVFAVLGVQIVFSSDPRTLFAVSSAMREEIEQQTDSPASREEW